MHHKRKSNKHRVVRKFGFGPKKLLHEWSRMLHRRWKLDTIIRKQEFDHER